MSSPRQSVLPVDSRLSSAALTGKPDDEENFSVLYNLLFVYQSNFSSTVA